MNARFIDRTPPPESAIVALPVLPDDQHSNSRMSETQGLVEALGVELAVAHEYQIRQPNPATLFGGGQLDRILQQADEHNPTMVVVDGALTPIQQRNLERRLQLKVIDRTGLILEIFGLRARTAEGRLQVELARQLYERSRLVRTWTHLERQRGGSGFLSGPGETQIESDRRMLDIRIKNLRRDIEDVRRSRAIQRAGRRKQRKPVVALVGYTNSGKSTLFNRLTGAQVLAQDMPFATLDPTVRELDLGDGRVSVMVDTVGFITDLPSHLIAAFRATLEEVAEAALLIHVRDIAHPDSGAQAKDVDVVLEQIFADAEIDPPPTLEVWNKIDQLNENELEALAIHARGTQPPPILISAITGEGLDRLISTIANAAYSQRSLRRIEIPTRAGDLHAWLHAHCEVRSQRQPEPDRIELEVLMSDEEIARFDDMRRATAATQTD